MFAASRILASVLAFIALSLSSASASLSGPIGGGGPVRPAGIAQPLGGRPGVGSDAPTASLSGGPELLRMVRLGESWLAVRQRLGMPTVSAFHANIVEWAYPAFEDKGWFVVRFNLLRVESVQIVRRYKETPAFKDESGIAVGDPIQNVAHLPGAQRVHDNTPMAYVVRRGSATRVYGAGRDGKVDRIGDTLSDTNLSAWIRWYKYDGLTPERAISTVDAYGGGATGEQKYLSEHACGYTGATWRELSRSVESVRGARVVAAVSQCGKTAFKVVKYFEVDATRPSLLIDMPRAFPVKENRQFLTASASTPAAVWINRYAWDDGDPNAATILYNPADGVGVLIDYYVGYQSDPSNPVTSVDLYVDLPPQYQLMAPSELRERLASEKRRKVPNGLPSSGGLASIACAITNGTGKCNGAGGTTTWPNGRPCLTPVAETASGAIVGTTACAVIVNSHNQLPTGTAPTSGDGGGISGSSGNAGNPPGCNSVGNPIDVATGQVWFKTVDAQESGPNPLTFTHRYDSLYPQFQGALGVGWRTPYDARLDLTNLAIGQVNYTGPDCEIAYFGSVAQGYPSYDNYSGGVLAYNTNGTFTLTTWDKHVLGFNSAGYLTSIADRAGITLTIARNASNGMTSVTDHLGRILTFTLDSKNRVTKAVSSPAGLSFSFTYDSGTNCYSGDLCTATENDGGKWSFQYDNPTSYSGDHLLTEVLDPLSHVEEKNAFSLVQLPENDIPTYRVTSQSTDGGKNSYTFTYGDCSCTTYPTSKITTVTDGLNRSGTFEWNVMQPGVTYVPSLFNKGGQLSFTYDDFNRRTNDGEYTTYQYNRDIPITNPDGSTWPFWGFPGATDIYGALLQTRNGLVSPHTSLAYYPVNVVGYPTGPLDDVPQTIVNPSSDTPGSTVTDTYNVNALGELTTFVRAGYINGVLTTRTWTLTYTPDENIASYTTPRTDLKQTISYGYYPDTDSSLWRRGNLQTYTDPMGHVTTYASDTHSNCSGTCNNYNAYGEPESTVDANGVIRDLTYDAMGRPTSWILLGATGDATKYTKKQTYDAAGRPVLYTNANAYSQKTTYDNNNQVLSLTRLGTSSYQEENRVYGYDAMEEMTSAITESCVTPAATCASWSVVGSQSFAWFSPGQLQSGTYNTATPQPISYGYNNQYSGQDINTVAHGNTSVQPLYVDTYEYDQTHSIIQYFFSGSMGSFATRNFMHQIDSIEQYNPFINFSTDYNRDDFGNRTSVVSPTTGKESFVTDPVGNVLIDALANGVTKTMTYDADNRLLTMAATKASVPNESVSITYDSTTSGNFGIGRVASVTDPSGTTSYAYNRLGKVTKQVQVVNGTQYTLTMAYDGDNNVTTIALPTGHTLTYTYDFADRPTSVKSATTTYVSAATYAPFGSWNSITFGNGVTQTRTFDQSLKPLTDVVKTSGGTALSNLSYQYMATGQIGSIVDNINSAYDQTFGYDNGTATNSINSDVTGTSLWGTGQYSITADTEDGPTTIAQGSAASSLVFTQPNILTSVNGVAVSEDASGNETAVGSATYTYSARNYLSSGDGLTYSYDWRGRRVVASESGATRGYLYSPDGKLYAETSTNGTSLGYDYIWFGSIPVAQDVVGGATYWTQTNRIGAPFMQTDSTGKVYWQIDYYPYGNVYQARVGATVHQPLRYPGQEAEQVSATSGVNGDTARFYNGARWYRPAWGRYTQPDPLGLFSDPTNLYGYALMNPEMYVDPSGLCGTCDNTPPPPMPPPPATYPPQNWGLPGGFTWSNVYCSGETFGSGTWLISAEGLGGTYDFQRWGAAGPNSGVAPANWFISNFGVGVYAWGAGIPMSDIDQYFGLIVAYDAARYNMTFGAAVMLYVTDTDVASEGYNWAILHCHG